MVLYPGVTFKKIIKMLLYTYILVLTYYYRDYHAKANSLDLTFIKAFNRHGISS